MGDIPGSPDEMLYSFLHVRHAAQMKDNETIKNLVFGTYDEVCFRQLKEFENLFRSMMHAIFCNPYNFPNSTTEDLESFEIIPGLETMLPNFDDSKKRVLNEVKG